MLGVLDGNGDATNHDPVNHESAVVQCAVSVDGPMDLLHFDTGHGMTNVASFMGQLKPYPNDPTDSIETKAYRAASPVTYVSPSSVPMLLIHGDHDQTVPYSQSEVMAEALKNAGVDVKLILLRGGGHVFAAQSPQHPEWGDPMGEPSRWLDQHLKKPAAAQ